VSDENIRALNDAFGTAMTGGRVFMTAGVDALSSGVKAMVIGATFTEFTPDNDPHGEHDFGNFGLSGLIQRGGEFGSAARRWSRSLSRPVAAASPSSRARRYQDAACLGSPGMPRSAGDIASARLFYQHAADAGNGSAALRLGASYDPGFLSRADTTNAIERLHGGKEPLNWLCLAKTDFRQQ
jgi:hypothetical protein